MASEEDDIDRELAQEEANEELQKDENFDDKEFEKYQQGELDLPEESDFSQSESDDLEDDPELDDYYRELGIEPEEMKPEAEEKDLYKTQAKHKKKSERV